MASAGEKNELENVDQVMVFEPDVFKFMLTIKRFPAVLGDRITSETFTSPINKTEWRVKFLAQSWNGGAKQLYIVFQLVKSAIPLPSAAEFAFSFLDSEMKIRKGPFTRNSIFRQSSDPSEWKIDTLQSFMDTENGFLDGDGTLNLLCQVTTPATKQNKVNAKYEDSRAISHSTMSQQSFKSFLENGEFADLTLSTKTSSFPASKIILAGQSPVFRVMFLSEMRESKENVVKIEDFSDEAVKGFLEFLFTGQTETLKENAVELLKISEKYQVLPLKNECEKMLMKELNIENAAEFLVLANYYNLPELKSEVISFVKECRKDVSKTESFKQLKKHHPEILLDLYAEFD